jgi:hypothetical protein
MARQVVVFDLPRTVSTEHRDVAEVGAHHRRPRTVDHARFDDAADPEEPEYHRDDQCAPEHAVERLAAAGHAERAADIDGLGDEEGQRHREEQFDEPHLDELRDSAPDPVECQYTAPDESQHAHGPEQ